ncbi:MAG: SLBB domain-containing protein [Chitinispirillia bacterium]|nr:SLBB domain-containing protein [Chitinispirillia bacterium]MCL2242224.1 SLBB domain-containing protein [Chitinispirillia bacterium]
MQSRLTRPAVAWILALAVFTTVFGQPGLPRTPGRSPSPATGSFGSGSSIGSADGQSINPFAHSYSTQQPGTVLPSDNSIDENEYIIGSGDVFFATVVESPNIRYTAAVDQSGRAFISGIGLLNLGKTTYAKAKATIAEHIASKMRNPSEIYVTLIQTKSATISFTGRIRYPGSYEFPGSTRLLDAIRSANDGDLPQASDADMRQIICARGDTSMIFDLMNYLHKGDNTQNPYIYPGDQIRLNPTGAKVFISGAIKSPFPSFYPLKSGETLREFMTLFTLDNNADTGNIILYQSASNTSKTLSTAELDIALNDLDAITIPIRKNLAGMYTVSITGEVASPGHYPIIENSTSARQLIEKAGGTRPAANMDQAVVIRPIKSLPDRFSAGAQQLNAVRPEKGVSISMAASSLDYTVIKLILYNADKVILEPGDQIVIPKKDHFVHVSGNVKAPGAYPFKPGLDHNYYVSQAGGYNKNADKSNVLVFLKFGDVVQSIEPKCVEPGSVIVVPAKVQYKFLTQVVLPIITAVVTTVGVVISIYNIK